MASPPHGARAYARYVADVALSFRTSGALFLAMLAACQVSSPAVPSTPTAAASPFTPPAGPINRLPTGARLDPAARAFGVGSLPLAATLSPDSNALVLLLNGYDNQGVQVIDRASRRVVQTLIQPAAFIGLTFASDGRALYASGGNEDVIYEYAWADARATLRDSIVLAPHRAGHSGRRYPAGIATSPTGRVLYVAENVSDSLAVIDAATRRVRQRVPVGRYPYGVAVAPNGTVYVSAWGGHTIAVLEPTRAGRLRAVARLSVSRHPSALALNRSGSRLFVTSASTDQIDVIDTRERRIIAHLLDGTPAETGEGSTPDALALSRDGSRLYVAEADNNAVAVFALSSRTAGRDSIRSSAVVTDTLLGRLPVEWYPSALVMTRGDSVVVVNAKGHGSAANAETGHRIGSTHDDPRGYTLGQLMGSVLVLKPPTDDILALLTPRVARANGWDVPRLLGTRYPPFQHVVYIIKENRTYDQVFGDLARGDGDSSLVFFGRAVSPNAHALAERFGLWDRFLVNAEVSADGHIWSTAAYVPDYAEKTISENYSDRGRSYDYDGTNRDTLPADGDDVSAPAVGYIWDRAARAGLVIRNYGEFAVESGRSAEEATAHGVVSASKPVLAAVTNPQYPGFDVKITDQFRADVWMSELRTYVQKGTMPALEIVTLPNDHTAGTMPHRPTPRAYVADNDLALGRMIDALSHSPFWATTVVFVVEDDAQDGADHVDSHRAPFLVISPYSAGGVIHRFANTTDVLATIEEILGLHPMSQFDHFGRPLRGIWRRRPDLRPYTAQTPAVALTELNPDTGTAAHASAGMNFEVADAVDADRLNRVLWLAIKGPTRPYPGPTPIGR